MAETDIFGLGPPPPNRHCHLGGRGCTHFMYMEDPSRFCLDIANKAPNLANGWNYV